MNIYNLRLYIFVFCLTAMSYSMKAETKADIDAAPFYRHELRLSGAIESTLSRGKYNRMINQLSSEFGKSDEGITDGRIPLSINITYFYHLNRHLALGLVEGKAFDSYLYFSSQADMSGKLKNSFTYLMPTVKFSLIDIPIGWPYKEIDKAFCRIYTKVAIGAGRKHIWFSNYESKNELSHDVVSTYDVKRLQVAYQIVPLAFEFGRRKVRFFMELGYGTEGCINCGVSFHFMNESTNNT